MGKVGLSAMNQYCRSCDVYMGNLTYSIIGVMCLTYMGVLTAAYYVSRNDNPRVSLLCYQTQGQALGMSNELADLRFMRDVENHGMKMIGVFDSEIQKIRKLR